jgi:alkylresorcinol/alkylpyrone synthase
VPELAAQHAVVVLSEALADAGLERTDIATWILHAGGRKVLDGLRSRLALSAADTQWSSAILSEYGNLSSPFVFYVLEAALRGGAPPGWWWMSSFGAGFSCHGALLEVA